MEHGSPSSARVSLVDGLFEVVGFAGGVLVAAGLVLILMAWNGTDERMPTQVPPRRLARYPIAAGTLLLVVAAVGLVVPGG
jgi:multisubunit Na+/H+ antiporter MnhB subunit